MLKNENANINTEKDKRTCVARKYRGAGESTPRSQVDRMPPKFPVIVTIAIAVARLVWGAVLLAFQVKIVGPQLYAPVIEKNKEAYRTSCFSDAKNSEKPIMQRMEQNMDIMPRQ